MAGGELTKVSDLLPKLALRRNRPQEVVDMGCPWSGGPLLLRQGPKGEFLGCADYPECNYTEPLYANVLPMVRRVK